LAVSLGYVLKCSDVDLQVTNELRSQ
jgi:hypothetical protein